MIVYGEILLAENIVIGGVLLWLTGQIYGVDFRSWRGKGRLAAGSVLCGLFAMVIFLPVGMPVTLLMEAGFAFLVCFIVFGREKLWQKAVVFLLVTYFMGGVTMALLLATGNSGIYTASGIYTGDMKAGLLALFVAAAWMTARQIIRVVFEKKLYQEHTYRVKLAAAGLTLETTAFLDTGNRLREPVSGKPVAVADEALWTIMESRGFLQGARFCVIPYEAIGTKGILEGIRMDYIEVGHRRIKGCVIAKNDERFRLEQLQGERCGLLLSKDMADGKF